MSVWISAVEYQKMGALSLKYYPCEAGGTLIGYRSGDGQDIVITKLLPPGPNAFHGKYSYTPDYGWDENKVGKAYDNSNGLEYYLGDWHSHPDGASALSWRDRIAMKNIARYKLNYNDSPIMLILSGSADAYDIQVWRISKQKCSFLSIWEYICQDIIIY